MLETTGDAESARLTRARGAHLRWGARPRRGLLIVESVQAADGRLLNELDSLGIRAELFRSGAEALIAVGSLSPGAAIIGLDLVDVRLKDWVSAVRKSQKIPIYVSLGNGSVDDARDAILAGATGILSGGCNASAIARCVSDVLRPNTIENLVPARMTVGPLEIDVPAFDLRVRGTKVSVPLKEFELLACLMMNASRVVSFDEIGEWLWGADPDRPSKRMINSHVQKLRTHLGDHGLIRTVRGQGYSVSHL
jgi:two-component system OmpR family response regulator